MQPFLLTNRSVNIMSPRTKQQFEELREQSREKIMEAALDLFGTKGFDATSITDIAKKAGVSKGLLYHYFSSKEHLVKEMIDGLNKLEEEAMSRVKDQEAVVFLENLIDMFFKEMRENYQWWRLLMNMTFHIEKFDFVHQMAEQKFLGFTGLFEQLFHELGYEDPKGESMLLAAVFDGIGIQYYLLKEDYPLDEFEKALKRKYCSK